MKKKNGMIRLLTFIIAACLMVAGCSSDTKSQDQSSSSPTAAVSESASDEIQASGTATPERDTDSSEPVPAGYQVERVKEQLKNVQIQIPQLGGEIGQQARDQVNANIRKELFGMAGLTDLSTLEKADPASVPDDLTFESDFRITLQKPEALSLMLTAYQSYTGAAHPNHLVRTLTFDLTNGQSVRAADCVDAGNDLIQAVRNYQVPDGAEKEVTVEAVRYVNESMDDAALQQKIKDMDGELYGPTSYWTDGKFGLNFETIHALGDFVQLEIALDTIRGSVKNEPAVCKVLAGK